MDELDLGLLRVAVAIDDGIPVVRLSGELDTSSADAARAAIARSLPPDADRVVFDLTELRFMDSSGIALMLSVADHVGSVELEHPSPIVRRIVEATGLAEVLRLRP